MSLEVSPAFKAQSRATEVYIVNVIFFVISIIAVCARLAAARISGRKLALDDWLAVTAGVFITGLFIGIMLLLRFGLGRHAIAVQEEDPANITRYFQAFFTNDIMYPLGLGAARLSIVVLYHRIFGHSSARHYLFGAMALILAWVVFATIPAIVACHPIENFWTAHTKCLDLARLYFSTAVTSIVTDFVLILIPIPYTLRLTMSPRKKILIMLAFVCGGFNCLITIIRLTKVAGFDFTDSTWGPVDLMVWSGWEAYSGVICCCLPTLLPLFYGKGSSSSLENFDSGAGEGNLPKLESSGACLEPPPPVASRTPEDVLSDYRFVEVGLVRDWTTSPPAQHTASYQTR